MKAIFYRKRDSDGSQSIYARAFTSSTGKEKADVVLFSMTSSDKTLMRALAQKLTDDLNSVVSKFYGEPDGRTGL
jgi:electron transfer flavoprotein alpha subunit